MIQYTYQNNLKEDMPMKLEKLQFVVEDGVGIITMNYMKNLNAIDDQMADELMYVVDTCENDPNVKSCCFKRNAKGIFSRRRHWILL